MAQQERSVRSLTAVGCALLWAWTAGIAAAESRLTDEHWYAVLLDGHKVGYGHETRYESATEVRHANTTEMTMSRGGIEMRIRTVEETVETPEGRPLSFRAVQDISGASMIIEGTVDAEGVTHVTTTSAGNVQTQTFSWPEGALLPEALNQLERAKGLAPQSYSVTAFLATSLQAIPMTVEIVGTEPVELFDRVEQLVRIEQTMMPGATPINATVWLDEAYNVHKIRSAIMGLNLDWIACDQACAQADANPPEFFAETFIRAPRSIDRTELANPLRLHLSVIDQDAAISIPESHEQTVETVDGGWQVTISPAAFSAAPASTLLTNDAFLSPTRWLQSDASEVQQLTAEAIGDAQSALDKMQRIEDFVAGYVTSKSLSVGYASALEVVRDRAGDCTEHAVLVAAMGRAAGIPTRVVSGFAYSPWYLDRRNVFVPHAWAQAWIDGRWHSFDAALRGFTSGHLALAYGDGDPWSFYDNINAIGNLRIDGMEPL